MLDLIYKHLIKSNSERDILLFISHLNPFQFFFQNPYPTQILIGSNKNSIQSGSDIWRAKRNGHPYHAILTCMGFYYFLFVFDCYEPPTQMVGTKNDGYGYDHSG